MTANKPASCPRSTPKRPKTGRSLPMQFGAHQADRRPRRRPILVGCLSRTSSDTRIRHLDANSRLHSITSSASSRNESEIASPIALAVLRLTINS